MADDKSAARGGRPIVKPDPATRWVGQSVNAKGNELALRKREAGRIFRRVREGDRPEGMSEARFVTGVNPLPSITGSPYLPRA